MERPYDFLLLMTTTDDAVWTEEMRKHPGTRALLSAMRDCDGEGCPMDGPREHLQFGLGRITEETFHGMVDHLADFEDSSIEDQREAMHAFLFEAVAGGAGRAPQVLPDGMMSSDMLPPDLREIVEEIAGPGVIIGLLGVGGGGDDIPDPASRTLH